MATIHTLFSSASIRAGAYATGTQTIYTNPDLFFWLNRNESTMETGLDCMAPSDGTMANASY